ncbi:HAMP domain-containing histidine kinase [Fusibacter paucivorans]|uniref:histidine kinase n=1 Tax=Fusibacter paucivorans TaxID=76009 RepID=A0ABS5PLI1_9FIRM|nr:HAMP domain-containing sensor histidine kinase [Fusibacter paucivorans]MBS7525742.1 HAMP domain-containing histidine kinase [Fusibacter paucivorans]
MQFSRDQIKKTMSKLRFKLFGLWILSAVIPIIVLMAYLGFTIGPGAATFFINPEKINNHIWQLDDWNHAEKVYRIINSIILDSPEKLLNEEGVEALQAYDNIRQLDYIVIIRKDQAYYAVNDFDSDEGQAIVEKLKNVDDSVLPPFGSTDYSENDVLLKETGYTIARQVDFYFSDGSPGSVLFFVKVINIPGLFGKFLLSYFTTIFVVYIIGISMLSVFATFQISRRLENIIYATDAISREQFDIKIYHSGNSPFEILGTHIELMALRLASAKKYRESVEQARNEFIDNMAHDLKTPLTAIKMQVAAIKDGIITDPDQIAQYLVNIERKADNIDQMLNELKIFSQLVNGDELYELQLLHYAAYVKDVVEEWRFDAGAEEIELYFDVQSKAQVRIDPLKFKRVLINIFENALKYVQQRPLQIHIKLVVENQKIILSITDNGLGVAEEKLPNLFRQYYRVDDARGQIIPGSGLGLAICKEIVEQHGGDVEAYNSNEGGLTVAISLEVADE